jgi:hypothetical protein
LHDRNNENSKVLVGLKLVRQKIDNIQKQIKDLENIRMERDSLQAIFKETNANYWGLKVEKGTLNIEHNKFQKVYRHMEEIFLK